MKKLILTVIAVFIISACFSQQYIESLNQKLSAYVTKNKLIGLGVAVVNHDSVIYSNGFGYANREKNIAYTTQTVQLIASISKTFIGISLMKAQEMGKLNLDDDINLYLPFKVINPYFPDHKITIRHLASHSSGLRDTKHYEKSYVFSDTIPPVYKKMTFGIKRVMVKKYVNRYNSNSIMPLPDFLRNIYATNGVWYRKSNFLRSQPGQKYEYSNNGAALAALVIEGATGIPYKEFVKKHILDPINMAHTGWSLMEYAEQDKSVVYFINQKIPDYETITYPDGGLVTNVDDFSWYLITMIRGYFGESNIISSAGYKEMMDYQIDPNYRNGIFWDIQKSVIGHTGGDPGVSTLAYFGKKEPFGIIIFINSSNADLKSPHLVEIFQILRTHNYN